MTVLITGATGFVGSHVARLLVEKDQKVHAIVRETSRLDRMSDIRDRVRLWVGDLRDREWVRATVSEIEPKLCVHTAWYAEPGRYLDAMENVDSLAATVELARCLFEGSCRTLVVTGTCLETVRDESGRAQTLYAACKLAAFDVVERMARQCSRELVWARLFYQFGPWEDPRRLVPVVIRGLLRGDEVPITSGVQMRDFLTIEDVAGALWALGQNPETGAFDIGSGRAVAVRDVVETIAEEIGRPDLVRVGVLPDRPGDPEVLRANPERLEKIGWRPRYSLHEGLQRTIAWWRDHDAS